MDHWLGRRSRRIFTRQEGPAAEMSELNRRQAHATYCGLASEVDANLDHILDFLEESAQMENTLIIHDPSTPMEHRGSVVEAFTEAVDIMPTILDWLGLDIPV